MSTSTDAAAYDAVVIGGGVSGWTVAARLARSGRRVLLAEAGPGEPRPPSLVGLDTIAASREMTRHWPELTVDRGRGSTGPYRQGYGLGGGSIINSMVLSPGDSSDYRRWASQHQCPDWGPDQMAPWLATALGALAGGPVRPGSFSTAFAAAAVAAGHDHGGSSATADRAGLQSVQLARDGLRRRSILEAWDGAASDSDGPEIRCLSPVSGIRTEAGRAVGIELASGRRIDSPLVMVCAGAIQTPGLLLRSGLDHRPVGARLKDHPSFALSVSLRPDAVSAAPNSAVTGERPDHGGDRTISDRTISTLLRWFSPQGAAEAASAGGSGGSGGDLQAMVIDRVDGADDGDQISSHDGPAERPRPGPLAVVAVGLMAVSSTGSVTVDADGKPVVNLGSLRTADDRARLRHGVADMIEVLSSGPLAELVEAVHVDEQGTPARDLLAMSHDDAESWIAAHPGPYAHPAGSCAMGPAEASWAVVEAEAGHSGRLHGYDGIYLADASIMPDLVSGGLQLPVAAMAARIADERVRAG